MATIQNGAPGDWHLVRRSPQKCVCPHVRRRRFCIFINNVIIQNPSAQRAGQYSMHLQEPHRPVFEMV